MKYNEDLYKSADEITITFSILIWTGHGKWMNENQLVRRIMKSKAKGIRMEGGATEVKINEWGGWIPEQLGINHVG